MIPLKIVRRDGILRARASRESLLQDFRNALGTALGSDTLLSDVSVRYQDEEGEWCSLLRQQDMDEALQLFDNFQWTCLKLNVVSDGEQPAETSSPTAYNHAIPAKKMHPMAQALLRDIQLQHQQVAEQTIDWFLRNMPEAYFRYHVGTLT